MIDDLRRLRLRAQRLAPRHAGGAAGLVRALGGVQAQDPTAAALAIRARTPGLTMADVERARVEERSVVRTWAMRGTLHLVAAEDVRWLLRLLGPRLVAADRRRRAELGLDEAASVRGVEVIRDRLAGAGASTRAEVAAALAAAGIPHEGQATVHLLFRAALEGHLCHGPRRDGEPTFVPLEGWLPPMPEGPPDPLAVLARRYRASHAPGTAADFAYWSGLGAAEARAGWAATDDAAAGEDAVEAPAEPVVRLLPAFDEYLLGWRDRSFAVPAAHARRVHPGGGLIQPVVLVDGRAAATWRRAARGDRLEVCVEPFEALPAELRPALEAEADEVGRFLGVTAALGGV
ncbi:MAG TPA: winged helix DNA-binding domain-containing protein [Chloroflexota bacterium]|nr:winged helix DNA-binding domain-containing protein [Chloroflexota bacterium]